MAPGQPATIGRYTVRRLLGRGGMGTVYLAADPLIEREVAIKVLPLAGADEYSDRLIAEARVSGRLIHPNIVGVFDIGEEQGQPFVVMPYVPGRTVASILTDRDRPAIGTKLRWMAQLCDALAYAHEHRVIHRDIKPTNLLIDDQQHLRVLDFGIAKVLTTSQIQFTSVGTPAYMAPEQYSSDPVDPRTDVFSAGLVLYELITHRRALTGTTPAQIYGQLMAGPPPRVLAAAPDTEPALAAVCERAMSREPRDRFQTAREFGEAIEAARTGAIAITLPTVMGVPAQPQAPPPLPTPEPVAVPPPVVVPPPAVPALTSTIRLERPDHDAILDMEALASPPEFGPEPASEPEPDPVVERDERTDIRPGTPVAITAAIIVMLAGIAALLWYLGSSPPPEPLATTTQPAAHEPEPSRPVEATPPATPSEAPVAPVNGLLRASSDLGPPATPSEAPVAPVSGLLRVSSDLEGATFTTSRARGATAVAFLPSAPTALLPGRYEVQATYIDRDPAMGDPGRATTLRLPIVVAAGRTATVRFAFEARVWRDRFERALLRPAGRDRTAILDRALRRLKELRSTRASDESRYRAAVAARPPPTAGSVARPDARARAGRDGSMLRVRVRDSLSNLSDVTVALYSASDALLLNRTTDALGVVEFAGLGPGPYRVTASRQGFSTTSQRVEVAAGAPAELTLRLTRSFDLIDPSVERGTFAGTTTTDASGSFSLKLTQGLYDASVTATGFSSAVYRNVLISDGSGARLTPQLTRTTSPKSTLGVSLHSATGRIIDGTVKDASGRPVQGAVIRVWRQP